MMVVALLGAAMNEHKLRVAIRAFEGGGYTFQIFTVGSEPRTLLSAKYNDIFASPAEAEQAGYEAVEALRPQPW